MPMTPASLRHKFRPQLPAKLIAVSWHDLLAILVPLLVIIVPLTRIVPPIYRWRVRSRIYRWYGKLISIERDMISHPELEEGERILQRLDEIENAVNNIKTPLSFADQLYVLRQHIAWVRPRLMDGASA